LPNVGSLTTGSGSSRRTPAAPVMRGSAPPPRPCSGRSARSRPGCRRRGTRDGRSGRTRRSFGLGGTTVLVWRPRGVPDRPP